MPVKQPNLIPGARFGRLVVVSDAGIGNGRQRRAACRCDCGAEVSIVVGSLRNGNTNSCGCLCKDRTRALLVKHGRAHEPLYGVWRAMVARCHNPNDQRYSSYGARGIRVCERWHSLENFLADMAPRPHGLQLDRKDNDGDYSPDNCRWATRLEQMSNTRQNVMFIGLNDKRMSLAEVARYLAVSRWFVLKHFGLVRFDRERRRNAQREWARRKRAE